MWFLFLLFISCLSFPFGPGDGIALYRPRARVNLLQRPVIPELIQKVKPAETKTDSEPVKLRRNIQSPYLVRISLQSLINKWKVDSPLEPTIDADDVIGKSRDDDSDEDRSLEAMKGSEHSSRSVISARLFESGRAGAGASREKSLETLDTSPEVCAEMLFL